MNKELLERTIEMLKWAVEDDASFLKWSKDKPTNEIDTEMVEHLSWMVEERTDIVKELTKLQ
tara:strand:+ start:340 stop:525 length:186 start_codon:yes stop_codon:yes gene_type:complete